MVEYKVYDDYYDLLTSDDRFFKDGLLWWFLGWPSDYEYSYEFLKKRKSIAEIELELFKRLTKYNNAHLFNLYKEHKMNKDLIKLLKKYERPFLTGVEIMGTFLYEIFFLLMEKKTTFKSGTIEDNFLYGVNRVIRCFADAGLLKKDIPRNGSTNVKEDVCRMVAAFAIDVCGWTKELNH